MLKYVQCIYYSEWSETIWCFIIIAFQICFIVLYQEGMELNGTPSALVCADNVNLLGENMNTERKNTEVMLDASTEVGP
jgi:hypothetical protein